MDKIVIPSFLSEPFRELETKEERLEFIRQYKLWRNNDMTEHLVRHLEREISSQIKKEESKDSFLSLFDFKFQTAHGRGYRHALRNLIKQLGV